MSEEEETYKVVETLVNELDKHGHVDYYLFVPNNRDPNVLAALAVGRAWLEAHAATARAQEIEELCLYYNVPDPEEDGLYRDVPELPLVKITALNMRLKWMKATCSCCGLIAEAQAFQKDTMHYLTLNARRHAKRIHHDEVRKEGWS